MVEIDKPRIECIDSPEDPAHGIFIVEPLERGYGTTLGNSLRRILLSSLPVTAATSIKIAGVQHEFSTIPGVKEDVTEIVLNIKRIIFKMNCDGVKTVYIDASGECEVTAGDIKTDDDVEILNKDLHICSLGPDAMLNMEITMSRGRGYVPADRNKTPQTPIGVIPVDSLYSPVYKVNYTVENTRVGNMTDFDKLTLEVWTDSTTTAKDAVSIAAKILTEHLALFQGTSETTFEPESTMNRAMLATVIYRMAGSPAGAAKAPFTDVAAADWFADAVAWAYENGVVKGMSATSFAPLQEITREQLAVMLLRYADLCGYDTSARTSLKDFADAAKVSDYAADAMQWAVANGILNGTDGKRLDPAGSATRAQCAAMLVRFLDKFEAPAA